MITTEGQRRALRFVQAANSTGVRPRARDVREWLDRPDPLPGKKGKLLRPAEPATPATPGALANAVMPRIWSSELFDTTLIPGVASALGRFGHISALPPDMFHNTSLFGTRGSPGRPAKYAPDGPPEHTIKQLRRLGWLRRDAATKGLLLTSLGRALLEADTITELGIEESAVLVLGAQDELAWGRLLGHLSELDNVFVVDPYLKDEQLSQLKDHTDVRRILVGPKLKKHEFTALRVLAATPSYEHIDIRVAPLGVLHDRYVINDVSVHLIGGSLNNIGRSTTTMMVPLPNDVAHTTRELAGQWWDQSSPLSDADDDS